MTRVNPNTSGNFDAPSYCVVTFGRDTWIFIRLYDVHSVVYTDKLKGRLLVMVWLPLSVLSCCWCNHLEEHSATDLHWSQGKMTKNNYYFPKDSIHKVTLCESFNSHFNRDPHNGEFCISEKVPSTDFSHVQVGHVKFTASTDRTLLGLKETSVWATIGNRPFWPVNFSWCFTELSPLIWPITYVK